MVACGRAKESNARFVEWSDGSMTLHVGSEVLQVKKEVLENNSHHLFVKHNEFKAHGEAPGECAIIESHGVLEARMVIKKTQHETGRKILATVSKQYGKKQFDKDSLFVRNFSDNESLAAQVPPHLAHLSLLAPPSSADSCRTWHMSPRHGM